MQVKVRNPQFNRPGVWFFEQPEFFEFEGEEVHVKWFNANQMGLTTGNPEFPMRVLQRDLIVSINNVEHVLTEAVAKTFTVKGSKGEDYIVTLGKVNNCTCSGFQFRRTCKHIKEVENV
jgi:hypothetical protein